MPAKNRPFTSKFVAEIPDEMLAKDRAQAVRLALAEDVGSGDVTASLVDPGEQAQATIIVREDAVLCGRDWVALTFESVDASIALNWHAEDGDRLTADQVICDIQGPARALLTAERTALNFLQTLSGTATTTQHYVEQVADTHCRLLDTRKTIPGLRLAQKYATFIGGAKNHRIGLFDAILIKENHIASAGSIANAIDAARTMHPTLPIETEVESLDELSQALNSNVDRVLLDNFPTAQ
ncbi:MAG: carboxylating nicotinate-nucleotide diphosphorylase, partial [Pseudomonadota bacterium]